MPYFPFCWCLWLFCFLDGVWWTCFCVFCQKRISYTGIFEVWRLGTNLRKKYAFTFIQHSRSMYWLISTQGCDPKASKFPLLLRRFHGNDPSYKMGRVCFSSGTNRPLAPLARAQDIRVCCVKWVSVANHSTKHVAAWDTVSKGISIRFTIKDGEQTVQFRQRLTTNSSELTLIIKKPSRSSKLSTEFEQSVSEFWSTQGSFWRY